MKHNIDINTPSGMDNQRCIFQQIFLIVLYFIVLFLPNTYNLSHIHGMYAGREIGIHFPGHIIAEILHLEGSAIHDFALYHSISLLEIGRSVPCKCHMQPLGLGLVAVPTTVLAHILKDISIRELHHGEILRFLHKFMRVSLRGHIDCHQRKAPAPDSAYAASADGHGVVAILVAGSQQQSIPKVGEWIDAKTILYLKLHEPIFCLG